jgi:LmbE family N-acetylglucosaminyl deacetylase
MRDQVQLNHFKSKPLILAVFAHPDDEAFLTGGTLAYYAGSGVDVKLLCLTQGEQGYSDRFSAEERRQLPKVRKSELAQSCEVMGVKLLSVLDFPDGRLSEISLSKLAQPIAHTIWQLKPDIVLTFGADGLSGHPDHIALHHAATLAFEIAAQAGTALFYSGLSEKSVEQLTTRLEGSLGGLPLVLTGVPQIELDTAINISHTANLKWMALGCHQSQAHNFTGLTEADRQLLSQSEYFQLAQVAGAYAVNTIQVGHSEPLALDLFSRLNQCPPLLQTA